MKLRKIFAVIAGCLLLTSGCGVKTQPVEETASAENTASVDSTAAETSIQPVRSLDLRYADQFSVDFYENGYSLIKIADGEQYLVVPEQETVPENLPEDITVLQQPFQDIYLVATSAMDLFCQLDALDSITLSGTDASGWYIEEARKALEEERIFYAGKYNSPDYELILSNNCDLAVESTMIYHNPEVKEQLEQLGIPVLVERSSYESHPFGRMEWIKLYGVLLGKEEQATECFDNLVTRVEEIIPEAKSTGSEVAFFYIGSNGAVNVRKPGDYITEMIEMAGGVYVPSDLGQEEDNALSTMNMQMESFYEAARDADYLIYNSTIDGELETLDDLIEKSDLLKDFKAVKTGNVWCTEKNFFQETMGLGNMILDIHYMLTETDPDPEQMTYLHPLQ